MLGTHLIFAGQCEAAFRCYERVLGARPGRMQTYADSPGAEQVPADLRGKIIHGTITIDGRELMGADVRPEEYQTPRGFYLLLGVAGLTNAERVFRALSENGSVKMEFQKTFWSPGFGVLVDQFGVPWEINCE